MEELTRAGGQTVEYDSPALQVRETANIAEQASFTPP